MTDQVAERILNELSDIRRELAMQRRGSVKPYYTTRELMKLTNKRTPKAIYNWCDRNCIPSHGHNQWSRKDADAILGIE